MYADQSKTLIKDRREQLRVKIKSLAVEASIIRKEEHRTSGVLREELYLHRVQPLRQEARSAHLAYGFIRGLTYDEMEPIRYTVPNWERVRTLIKKYGPKDFVMSDTSAFKYSKPKARGPRMRPTREQQAA